MANKKQIMKDFINWGFENDKNRVEAIDAACRVLTALYSAPAGKKLSDADLDKLAGATGPGNMAVLMGNITSQ